MEQLDGVRLWSADDLERGVEAFADHMCGTEQFATAAEDAEAWIRERVPVPS